MALQTKPLAEITQEAIQILFQTLGVVDTVRFLNQFTLGYGDYTADRETLFGDMTVDELIAEMKRDSNQTV